LMPVAQKMAPAQKNKVILPKACMAIWTIPPVIPFGERSPTPSTM